MPEQHLLKEGGRLFELVGLLVKMIYELGGGDQEVRELLRPTSPHLKNFALLVLGGVEVRALDPYTIATGAKTAQLRIEAIRNLSSFDSLKDGLPPRNLDFLKMVALSPEPGWSEVRMAAVEEIASLHSPDWEQAIQAALKEIALDHSREAAEAATTKLTSLDDVFDVVMRASHRSTRFEAIKRLDETRLARVVVFFDLNPRDPELQISAIQRMQDQDTIENCIVHGTELSVRRAAALRLRELK